MSGTSESKDQQNGDSELISPSEVHSLESSNRQSAENAAATAQLSFSGIPAIRVQRLGCVADATINLSKLTVFVGPNGCGKSTFLRAIVMFFDPAVRVSENDFYGRDTTLPIEITIDFSIDSYDTASEISAYIADGKLRVTRVIEWKEGRPVSRVHGHILVCPAFKEIRNQPNAATKKQAYTDLRGQADFKNLPAWANKDQANRALRTWENEHPEKCEMGLDDGSAFDAGGSILDVAQLGRVVFVPAVRDASLDASDGRGSAIADLIDLSFRSQLMQRDDFVQLQERTARDYAVLLEAAKAEQLGAVEGKLSSTLAGYVTGAEVRLKWRDPQPHRLAVPSADVLIVEDGFESPVGQTGHGVQRAFTLSLLQEIVELRSQGELPQQSEAGTDVDALLPFWFLVIEEPELFQHPTRQRTIARVLETIADQGFPGIAKSAYVVYATHQPSFISVEGLESIKVFRKQPCANGNPATATVYQVNPAEFSRTMVRHKGRDSKQEFWSFHHSKLITTMDVRVCEALFARGVVLVEGPIDESAVAGSCRRAGVMLDERGVTITHCNGKSNILRLAVILEQLGISTYCVWDGDLNGREPKQSAMENRHLSSLVGAEIRDFPPTEVGVRHTIFEHKLEDQVAADIGTEYDAIAGEAAKECGFGGSSDVIKHAYVFGRMLEIATERGSTSRTVEAMVRSIDSWSATLAT